MRNLCFVFCLSSLLRELSLSAPGCTTGNWHFAECLRHSAKPEIHSAKALPSAALGKELIDKEAFAECFLSGTRQSLCRVPEKHSAKIYTRQNENAKKPKNNSKKKSGKGAISQRPSVQRRRLSKSL